MSNSMKLLRHKLRTPHWPQQRPLAPGILIMDNCTVQLLAQHIPDGFFAPGTPREGRPQNYLDLLKLLPKAVVGEVHVPDVGVYEMTHHCYAPQLSEPAEQVKVADRTNVSFVKLGKWSLSAPEQRAIAGLLGIVRRHDDVGLPIKFVHIPEFQQHLRKKMELTGDLEVIRGLDTLFSKDAKDHTKDQRKLQQVSWKVKGELKEQKQKEADFGELLSAQYGLDYAVAHHAPVTFLTEDHYAAHMLDMNLKKYPHRKDIEFYHSNFFGFMQALKDSGLLASVGLRRDLAPEAITRRALKTMDRVADSEEKDIAVYKLPMPDFVSRVTTAQLFDSSQTFRA